MQIDGTGLQNWVGLYSGVSTYNTYYAKNTKIIAANTFLEIILYVDIRRRYKIIKMKELFRATIKKNNQLFPMY